MEHRAAVKKDKKNEDEDFEYELIGSCLQDRLPTEKEAKCQTLYKVCYPSSKTEGI